jgi:hypothetical protein
MKLHELAASQPSKQIAKVFESYFGSRISFDQLSYRQTASMLNRVTGLLREHQSTPARHTSEQNPGYLKLVMMEQALRGRLKEMDAPGATAAGSATGQVDPAAAAAKVKNPKLAAALKKSTAGQTLSPDEQKLVAGAALMAAESRRRTGRRLTESEVQQAQVVLAAQDMVDKMQGMLEDVSELQFKELPALVDSIKNQVGIEQATQFNADASAALTGLMQNLQGAKQQMDQALGVVTGTSPAPVDAAAAGAMAGAEMGADAGADLGADLGAELGADAAAAADDLDAEEPAGAALGRARR